MLNVAYSLGDGSFTISMLNDDESDPAGIVMLNMAGDIM